MKSLQDIMESVLSDDAGVNDVDIEVRQLLDPVCDLKAWGVLGLGVRRTLPKKYEPNCLYFIRKIIKGFDRLGVPVSTNAYNELLSGAAILYIGEYKSKFDCFGIIHMYAGYQYMYSINLGFGGDDSGIKMNFSRYPTKKPIPPRFKYMFVIPGWIAKDIFDHLKWNT